MIKKRGKAGPTARVVKSKKSFCIRVELGSGFYCVLQIDFHQRKVMCKSVKFETSILKKKAWSAYDIARCCEQRNTFVATVLKNTTTHYLTAALLRMTKAS